MIDRTAPFGGNHDESPGNALARWQCRYGAYLLRLLIGTLAPFVVACPLVAADSEVPSQEMIVDAAIVLAADVSSSIDVDQARMQRIGHAEALRSPEVKAAIRDGFVGCIAVTYIEWSSVGSTRTVLPWTRLCDDGDANIAADEIMHRADDGSERIGSGRTSLSFALEASGFLLDHFPGEATRKIIDVSSNGTNNDGLPVAEARDRVVQKGYTINGIVLAREEQGVTSDLADYFRQMVIGGPWAFVAVPDRPFDYVTAIRRKLIREISGIGHRGDNRSIYLVVDDRG
ncbi:DUF1194 domain-containing protein [Metarhizobium album]|nr:DUF1194 domain-containing protein [Rhizobium album]